MENKNFGVIEDLSESDNISTSSSNNGMFEPHQTLVLELHDLKKDDPSGLPTEIRKKQKKKKKGQLASKKSHTSRSSSSLSDTSIVPPPVVDEHAKEEFYDAHESYHKLPENQVSNPVTAAALVQARSEHGPVPKTTQEQPAPTQAGCLPKNHPLFRNL
ncbi:uncharacterized protein LOC131843683 [Achroia grisella]|uniref:uncharacterized protein LOC131843683 n=1 Tax=Achroia grisella TaxID=688607 RepID=UPI0027D21E55|nr:uncharacterized protein LOC131843683 [Achroia grisella]